MLSYFLTSPPRLDADKLYARLANKIVKASHCIRAPTDACHYRIRKFPFTLLKLSANFSADNRLKISIHRRIRAGSYYTSNHKVCFFQIRHPEFQSFIHCIFESFCSVLYWDDSCTKALNQENIRALSFHIYAPHKDLAL